MGSVRFFEKRKSIAKGNVSNVDFQIWDGERNENGGDKKKNICRF